MSTIVLAKYEPSEAYKKDPSIANKGLDLINSVEGVLAYVERALPKQYF